MDTIGIIGNFDQTHTGGQVTKTQELLKYVRSRTGSYNIVDVSECRNPIRLALAIIILFVKSKNIAIILATPGYLKVLPMVYYLHKILPRPIYEFVIGGVRHEYFQNHSSRIKWEKNAIKKIYVESTYMEREYRKIGLCNAEYLPNYKTFEIVNNDSKEVCENNTMRLCTFSRVDAYKGIDVAIEIVKDLVNSNVEVSLDIIGPVSDDYKMEFENMLNACEGNIRYYGAVSSDEAIQTLKGYDVLLCPTNWKGEGFPGAFIDAMAAGVPILATNKQNFRDIIRDGYNGYLIDSQDFDRYKEIISEWNCNQNSLLQIKNNAMIEANKYKTDIVLEKFWKQIEVSV